MLCFLSDLANLCTLITILIGLLSNVQIGMIHSVFTALPMNLLLIRLDDKHKLSRHHMAQKPTSCFKLWELSENHFSKSSNLSVLQTAFVISALFSPVTR